MKRVCIGIGFHRVPAVASLAERRSHSTLGSRIEDMSHQASGMQVVKSEPDLPPHKRIRQRLRQSKLQKLQKNDSESVNFIASLPKPHTMLPRNSPETPMAASSTSILSVSRSPSPLRNPAAALLKVDKTPVSQSQALRSSPTQPPSTGKTDKRLSYTGTARLILDTLDQHITKPAVTPFMHPVLKQQCQEEPPTPATPGIALPSPQRQPKPAHEELVHWIEIFKFELPVATAEGGISDKTITLYDLPTFQFTL